MNQKLRLLGIIADHELRLLLKDRLLIMVSGLLLVVLTYGFYNGWSETRGRDTILASVIQSETDTASANLERLARVESGAQMPGPFNNPANPAVIGNGSGRQAVMHDLAPAPLAIGQSDMMPNYYGIGTGSKVDFMYESEIGSPWTLLSGHFDLAFVVVFLLPLLIFALTFNLLSAEREDGVQRLLLAQPVSLGMLVVGKLLPRAVTILTIVSLLPVILLIAFRPEMRALEQVPTMLGWVGIVLAYGAFWFAVAFFVNTLRLASSANALVLIAVWTVLVLIVPVMLNLLAEQVSPTPSRTELSIRTRAIQAENLRRYDDLFSGDYRYIAEPGSLLATNGRIEIPPRTRASFLARRDMDARVEGLLQSFDAAAAGQQAFVDRASILSPAVLTYEGITALAGTDGRRYGTFRENVSSFHDGWRAHFEPLVLGGIALDADDLRELPRWQAAELASGVPVLRIAAMMLFAAFMSLVGSLMLRRYRIA